MTLQNYIKKGGWQTKQHLDVDVRNGAIVGRFTGPDPILHGPPVAIEAEAARRMVVRMKADSNDYAQIFWSTSSLPMSENTCVHFNMIGDGKFHDYKIDLSHAPGWSGLVVSLRFDPAFKPRTKFTVESIRIE